MLRTELTNKCGTLTLKSARIIKNLPKSAICIYCDNDLAFYFTKNCAYLIFDTDFIVRFSHRDFNRLVRHLFTFFEGFGSTQKVMEKDYVV